MKKSPIAPKPYPSDVSDEEWSFVVPYLTLCRLDSEQREHDLRSVFNALRWLVRSGAPWRMTPHDFPPWAAVYQQTQRWLRAGCFEAMVNDLRLLLREYAGRAGQPSAVILDSRTLYSTPESGSRAGYDGAKRRKGAKVHAAVGTLGHLLALQSLRPMSRIEHRCNNWRRRCRNSPARAWSWLMWIRDIPERTPNKRRGRMASNWRWSSTPKPSAVLSCCRAAGWSKGASLGRRVSAVWHVTMSASLKRLLDSTTSPSPASCFIESFRSYQVHNRL